MRLVNLLFLLLLESKAAPVENGTQDSINQNNDTIERIITELSNHYDDSKEINPDLEARRVALENLQELVQVLLRNASRICPLGKEAVPLFDIAENLIKGSLTEIYEKEVSLSGIVSFRDQVRTITTALQDCLKSEKSRSMIAKQDILRDDHPERIIHLDLMNDFNDKSRWQDFRSCIRIDTHYSFYPKMMTSGVMDILWQSFLLAYFGCKEHWISYIESWEFFDIVQATLLVPLLKRWKSFFPTIDPTKEVNQTTYTLEQTTKNLTLNLNDTHNYNSNISQPGTAKSTNYVNTILEKCNVILFLKHPVDPIPCFKDVLKTE